VSSTKRTPDKPGRGPVAAGQKAAGQQVAESNGGNGSAAGAPNGVGNGAGNGRAGEPSTPPSGTAGAPPADGVTGSDIVAAGGKPASPPEEATTAQFTVPADKARPGTGASTPDETAGRGDEARPDGAATTTVVGPPPTAPSDPTTQMSSPPTVRTTAPPLPLPPTLDPVPAPAVPAPGPAAAQPPPWRRMGGHDARPDGGRSDGARSDGTSTADRLLDDGPTAFLEAPRFSPPPTAGAGAGDIPSDTGSWTRIPRTRPPRQAALQLKRLDPWSVLKLALVLAVVLFFIWLVAVGVLYGVLDGMGVWDRLNGTYADLVSGEGQTGNTLISAGRVFGLAAVVGAINSLLFAVAVTVGAFVYNVSADLVGGIEVTLSERD